MSAPVTSTHIPVVNPAIEHSRLGSRQHSAGGEGLIPIQTRSERFTSFDVTDFEPVSQTDAEWKYSPLAKFQPLLSSTPSGDPLQQETSVRGAATVDLVPRDDARIGTAGAPEDRASANAWSTFQQATAVTIRVDAAGITGTQAGEVIITRSNIGAEPRAAHTVITAEPHSRGLVIIRNSGPAMLTENVEIVLGDNAELTVVSVQEWQDDAVHLASHFAKIGRGARLKHVTVTLGGAVVRLNPSTHLNGERGNVEMLGVYFADAGQHIEHQVFVNHDAPHTVSRVSYKGALQGDGAHTVWIGDVLIGRAGSGTDSYEQNRNLLLTDGARADSVPNLEIETGDILGAGHATASGRFDDEQLFYLQARGITEEEARRLVVRGFLSEIIQKIGYPELEQRLELAIEAELRVS